MEIEYEQKDNSTTSARLIPWKDSFKLNIHEVKDLYGEHINPGFLKLARPFSFSNEIATEAEGCWIKTQSGKNILDFTGGVGVLRHGHNHPRILKARAEFQALKKMEVHKQLLSPAMAVLAKNISQILPGDLNFSFFTNSGAEAVEAALKMAFQYHGGKRPHVLHSNIAFHGKLLGAGSLTHSPESPVNFPKISNTHRFEFNNINSVKTLVKDLRSSDGRSTIYGLVIEPFNAGNLRECSNQFLKDLRTLCIQEDIVLIFDEVYTGWFGTGDVFAFSKSQVVPDIVCMSKSFGGGKASISAATARTPIFLKAYGDPKNAILHTTTYNGFGEETVTAIEAIAIAFDENFAEKTNYLGQHLKFGLRNLQQKFPELILECRGRGVLQGLIFNCDQFFLRTLGKLVPASYGTSEYFLKRLVSAAVVNELFDSHSVLTFFQMGEDVPFVVSPPAVATEKEMDIFLKSLDLTLSQGLLNLTSKLLKNYF